MGHDKKKLITRYNLDNSYCEKKNIPIHKRTAEFWRRHEETFPRLQIIAKMVFNYIL